MPTKAQLRARRRNFTIFRLRGAIAVLKNLIKQSTDVPYKLSLNSSVSHLEDALAHLKEYKNVIR